MSPHVFTLLRALSRDEFRSGEQLAADLKVSRATVWNAIQDIEDLGVKVFKVRGRGYRLAEPIEWLERRAVQAHFGAYAQDLRLEILDSTGSTNSELMRRMNEGAASGHCLVAEWQTMGRGRRGRAWQGVIGGSLLFSVLWRFNVGVAQLSGLSLVVGLALARALAETGLSDVQLKWPNDLMHNFRKLGGVLVELQGDALGPSNAVIGIGLNMRLDPTAKERIDQAVTDLHSVLPVPPSRNRLLGVTLRHVAHLLARFELEGFEAIRGEWQQRHAYHDKPVQICLPDGMRILGIVRGVMPDGSLVLETDSGERRFGSGEISLRPLNKASYSLLAS